MDSDPIDNFTGLATLYGQVRPDYPFEALELILSHCQLDQNSTLVDVGCGTGISSRAFARLGIRVIGIEPNEDMRKEALSANRDLEPAPVYRSARAEETRLPSASADAVLAAQAFHWFRAKEALLEFCRILRPTGWAVLLGNERDEKEDVFTQRYGDLVRGIPGATLIEGQRIKAAEHFIASELFDRKATFVFANEQLLDEQGLIARAFATSYAPKDAAEAEHLKEKIRSLYQQFAQSGKVVLKYETTVHLGQKTA